MSSPSLRYYSPASSDQAFDAEVDLMIYGATMAGLMAGMEARRHGLDVLIVNPGRHVGGMTTSGLGWTDFGNPSVVGGLARDFYCRLGRNRDGRNGMLWTFEPSAASTVVRDMITESGLKISHGFYIDQVFKEGPVIKQARSTTGSIVRALWFIDASYEGDLLARAGVDFATGREGNSEFGETCNGFQLRDLNQFEFPVDPYVVPGRPGTGLIPGVHHPGELPRSGSGDNLVQAYNFRLCMTRRPDLAVPFPRPADYDESRYELLARYFEAGWRMDLRSDGTFMKFDEVGSGKTDTNNGGAFSSDFIGGSWEFPGASYAEREHIFQEHVRYHQGLLWFLQTSRRVPDSVAQAMRNYGLAGDEFTDTGNWPPQLYIRECRRLRGLETVTERHCFGEIVGGLPAALGAYSMDSHNCQRVLSEGMVKNEGDVQVHLPAPYEIPFRAMVPRPAECTNLLVPVCLSATHIAYGSVRMEPVFMALGQAAGLAAAVGLQRGIRAQDLGSAELEESMRAARMVFRLGQLKRDERRNHNGNPAVPIPEDPATLHSV
jgi:hypothetical protein